MDHSSLECLLLWERESFVADYRMPRDLNSPRMLVRATTGVAGVQIEGYLCGLAPVTQADGRYRVSIVKVADNEEPARYVGHVPISATFPTFREALASLHLGFELVPPDDEKEYQYVAEAMAKGLITPFSPAAN